MLIKINDSTWVAPEEVSRVEINYEACPAYANIWMKDGHHINIKPEYQSSITATVDKLMGKINAELGKTNAA